MNIPGERDESLERWLQQLRPERREETDSCLDAETAAAWVTGSLSGDTLQLAQIHLADCDRCQSLIGSLVRTDVGGEPKVSAPQRNWMRWLAPIGVVATAAVAVGVWVSMPQPAETPAGKVAETVTTRQEAEVPLERSSPAPAGSAANTAPVAEASVAKERADAGKLAATETPSPTATVRDEARDRRQAAAPDTTMGRTLPTPPPAASARAPQGFSDAAAAPQAAQALSTAQAEATNGLEFVSIDQSVRWRITGRQLTRSLDRGASWEAVQIGITAALTSGSAPSRTVCWLVGRGGIVLLTTNGTTFTRVPFPDPVDLIAITGGDAKTAVVTATDGRIFRTADGGTTWTR